MEIKLNNIKNLVFRSIYLERKYFYRILFLVFSHLILSLTLNLSSEFSFKLSYYFNNFIVLYLIGLLSANNNILKSLNDEKYDFLYSILPVSQCEKLISFFIKGFVYVFLFFLLLFVFNIMILKLLESNFDLIVIRYDMSLFEVFKKLLIIGVFVNALLVLAALFFNNNFIFKSIIQVLLYVVGMVILIFALMYFFVNLSLNRNIKQTISEGSFFHKFDIISDVSNYFPILGVLLLVFIWTMNYFLIKEKKVY